MRGCQRERVCPGGGLEYEVEFFVFVFWHVSEGVSGVVCEQERGAGRLVSQGQTFLTLTSALWLCVTRSADFVGASSG